MKNYLMCAAAATMFGTAANATDLMPYANSVTANVIAGIQHTVSNRALVGTPHTRRVTQQPNRVLRESPDRYGTMRYYGEFGDDTGILPMLGRAGGDAEEPEIEYTPTRFGADFTYATDDIKMGAISNVDSRTSVARFSVEPKLDTMDVELFGGYAGHHSRNYDLDIDGDGAFFGIASRTDIEGFDLGVVANVGVMANTAKTAISARDFENVWAAATVGAGYNMDLLPFVTLRPAVNAGYMVVRAQNYVAKNGDNIDVKNLGVFSVLPSMNLDFQLTDGWHLGAHATYVMNFTNGGTTTVSYVRWADLDTKNYIEYDVGFGRRTERLDMGLSVGRHDIGRTGWHGTARISYLF